MLTSNISLNSGRAELLREAVLIVWEEFPMANKASIECADQLLRMIMQNNYPFGGKLFLALGDFRQVAPVIRNSSGPTSTYLSSIRSSPLWHNFNILKLEIPIRNATDPQYAAWIDCIGNGIAETDNIVQLDLIQPVKDICDAISYLYPPNTLANAVDVSNRSFLSVLNKYVDEFNEQMLKFLPGKSGMNYNSSLFRRIDVLN